MIQNVIQILRATVHPDQQDWMLKLPMTEFAINSSVSKSTRFAPFELIYGYMPQVVTLLPTSKYSGVQDFAQKALENLVQTAHDAILMTHIKQAVQVDRHQLPDPPLKVGNLTYLSTKNLNLPKGWASKLTPLFISPYKILETHKDTSNYTLKMPPEL